MQRPTESFVKIKEGDYTWWVRVRDQERLRREFIPLLSQGGSLLASQLLKRSDTRLIYRGNLRYRQEPLIVKAFKTPHLRDKATSFFRSPRSTKELRVAIELRRRGIPFPRVVAAGISRRFGLLREDVVLSREIIRATPLSTWVKKNFIEDPIPFQRRKAFLHTLASFVRKVHDRGICSDDFHQGNILLWVKAWEDPHFYLTDLHSLRIRGQVSLQERVKSLAHFNDYRIPLTDRLRFLTFYYHAGEPLGISYKELARKIGSSSCIHWQRLWKKRGGKCLRRGKELSPFTIGPWQGMVRNGYDAHHLLHVLPDNDSESCRISSAGNNENMRAVVKEVSYHDQGTSIALIVRYYKTLNLLRKMKALVQPSQAKRAWITGHNLLMRGIPTPLPVAFGEKRCGGLVRESFLITEKAFGAKRSDAFFTEIAKSVSNPEESSLKRLLLQKVARMLRWMHETGICLGGKFNPKDFLITESRAKPSLVFDGVDRVRVCRRVGIKEVARDLSSVLAAFADSVSSSEWDYLLSVYGKSNRLFTKYKHRMVNKIREFTSENIRRK